MSGDLTWRPLPQATSSDIPMLLVSVNIGTAAYTVRITDTANIWVESLDRKAICMRGWSENTSIDPSDTPENMAKFLGSLRSALDPTQPGHEQTSLTLSPGSSTEAGENGLTLVVTCPLPRFQPLKWPIHLKKSPPSAIATDLVLPLLEAQFARNQEVESLVQALNQKDAVIAKLADKLEATGTGLEHVFTSLSGKKKVSRATAEDKVKGLAPFRQSSWKSTLNAMDDYPTNVGDLARNVFTGEGLNRRSLIQVDASPALDKWWHDFKGTSKLVHRNKQQTSTTTKSQSPAAKSTSADDDDFQVQPTPPHLQSRNKSSPIAIPDDASTEDEEELPTAPLPAAPSDMDPQPNTGKSASRMANVGSGASKPGISLQDTKSTGSRATTAPVPKDDDETASEASDDDMTSIHPPASSAPTPIPASAAPKPPSKVGGLGRIGGTAKTSATETPKGVEAKEDTEARPTAKPPTPKKLGVIGKKADTGGSKAPAADNSSKRGRTAEREELQLEDEPRETSQERADRRREELKKELEKKAAAGPAKKKRRF
ncbi:XLF-domain-containing protein [Trichoderma sp. SZMC 28011]